MKTIFKVFAGVVWLFVATMATYQMGLVFTTWCDPTKAAVLHGLLAILSFEIERGFRD